VVRRPVVFAHGGPPLVWSTSNLSEVSGYPDSLAIRRGGFPRRDCGAGRSQRRCRASRAQPFGLARSLCGERRSLRRAASASARTQPADAAPRLGPSSCRWRPRLRAAYELSPLPRGRSFASSNIADEKCDQNATTAPWNARESTGAPRNASPTRSRRSGSTKGKGRQWPALLPMRPTRIELATFGLKDRRSLDPVKGPLTTELRAPCL
jgi:hypothetical protein